MLQKEPDVILFDGECNLCHSAVQFIIKRDRKKNFKFASLQSETGKALLKKVGAPENRDGSFVYINNNPKADKVYLLRSTAMLHVFKELGGVWKAAYLFIFIPPCIRDYFYNLIAGKRYQLFGKRTHCMIPGENIRDRFLK